MGRMHGMKTPAVHTLDEDRVAARIDDGHRNRDSRFLGHRSRGIQHFSRTGECETLGFGDIHGSVPRDDG